MARRLAVACAARPCPLSCVCLLGRQVCSVVFICEVVLRIMSIDSILSCGLDPFMRAAASPLPPPLPLATAS